MDRNQMYRNLINSEFFPLFKTVLKDIIQNQYLSKFSNGNLTKDDLFILQKQYIAIAGLAELIKELSEQVKEEEDNSL